MEAEIISAKQFFNSHSIILSEEWLESCIEWYKEEHPNSAYSQETLHQKVYEQWLLLDLRETQLPILPPNLNSTQKICLNGIFSLQLMYVIDISQSKYSQLQEIRNMTLNSADEQYNINESSKRMLELTLTDGVQEVKAVEYKPIPILDLNLTPGVKMKLHGPVTIRRGQIMLEHKNIEILGGEVEELLIQNATENILAQKLNLPLNPKPFVKLEISDRNTLQTPNITTTESRENQYIYLNDNERRVPQPLQSNRPIQDTANKVVQSRITSYISNSIKQDCVNKTIGSTSNFNGNSNTNRVMEKSRAEPIYIVDDEDEMIAECDNLLEVERELEMEQLEKQEATNNRFQNENVIDVFDEIDIDSHLDRIDQQAADNFKVTPISDLISNNITNGKFKIKAKFKSVSCKFSVSNNEQYSLRIIVTDNSGEMDMWVHTDVITNLIDCTPAVILSMKESIINKDPTAGNLIMEKITCLRSKIEQLDCVMEITFKGNEKYPTITNLM